MLKKMTVHISSELRKKLDGGQMPGGFQHAFQFPYEIAWRSFSSQLPDWHALVETWGKQGAKTLETVGHLRAIRESSRVVGYLTSGLGGGVDLELTIYVQDLSGGRRLKISFNEHGRTICASVQPLNPEATFKELDF